jgi:hypothetical protein
MSKQIRLASLAWKGGLEISGTPSGVQFIFGTGFRGRCPRLRPASPLGCKSSWSNECPPRTGGKGPASFGPNWLSGRPKAAQGGSRRFKPKFLREVRRRRLWRNRTLLLPVGRPRRLKVAQGGSSQGFYERLGEGALAESHLSSAYWQIKTAQGGSRLHFSRETASIVRPVPA